MGPRETMVAANKAARTRSPGGIGALQGVGWGPEFRVVTRARRLGVRFLPSGGNP
jgi:hypothetical protein